MSFPERPQKPQSSPPYMDQPVEPIEDSVVSDWIILLTQIGLLGAFVLLALDAWPLKTVSIAMLGLSGIVILAGLAGLGTSFRALASPNGKGLRNRGIYSIIRNPIYLGLLLSATGICLSSQPRSWILLAFLALVLLSKIHSEEKYLSETYPEYEAYRKGTKKLIPWVW